MIKSKPPDPGSQNESMKKNKNAELKKSKKKCQQDTLGPDIKPKSTYESNNTETLFLRSESNFETDSAIYSDSVVDDSNDSLETLDIEMDNLKIQDPERYQRDSGSRTQTTGICSETKLQAMGTEKPSLKAKYQQNSVHPKNTVPRPAFTQDCSTDKAVGKDEIQNERQTDGQSSDKYHQQTVELSPCVKRTEESLRKSRGGMSDFVIIHPEEDAEAVYAYMVHLQQDIGINNLSVVLFSNINAGESKMRILAQLHDKFRNILIYVTTNLKNDPYCQFQEEIVLSNGLIKGNGKEYRVVPVFTEKGDCEIPELRVLNGLKYFEFMSTKVYLKESYVKKVKDLVHMGREKFP